MEIKLLADGGYIRSDDGDTPYGSWRAWLVHSPGKVFPIIRADKGEAPENITGNNQAEYWAMLEGVKMLKLWFYIEQNDSKDSHLHIYSDSQLMCKQLLGEYKVKSSEIIPLYKELSELLEGFGEVSIHHIPGDKVKEILGH